MYDYIGYNILNLRAGQQNFGAISIDWNANPVTIKLEIRDVNGDTVLGTNVSLSELQPGGSNSLKDTTTKGKSQRYCTLEIELPGTTRYRLAVLIYFTIAGMSFFLTVVGHDERMLRSTDIYVV